jgi:hypothetical protein
VRGVWLGERIIFRTYKHSFYFDFLSKSTSLQCGFYLAGIFFSFIFCSGLYSYKVGKFSGRKLICLGFTVFAEYKKLYLSLSQKKKKKKK